jgi:hypothetical protein
MKFKHNYIQLYINYRFNHVVKQFKIFNKNVII